MEVFDFGSGCIVGKSKPIKQVFGLIPLLAKDERPVLIQGESGTGKGLIATAIHSYSPRSLSPFIKVNCAALETAEQAGDELFGSKFTAEGEQGRRKGLFEIAEGGTVLLDEISRLPMEGQAKLVQILHEKKFLSIDAEQIVPSNVRVIATTNYSLAEAVEHGDFREDLYYYLQSNIINLPVLRKLREDIPLLVRHFVAKYSKKYSKIIKGVSAEVMSILMEYDWPGNVRELEECIEQAVILERLDVVQAHSLPYDLFKSTGGSRHRLAEEFNLRRRIKAFERQLVLRALNECAWKKKEAAGLLGIDQRNLSYFLRKHSITDPATREMERGSL